MRVTEKEANQKLCHVVMAKDAFRTCSASACMAWRWCGMQNDQDEHLGYCGLAGEPASDGPNEEF